MKLIIAGTRTFTDWPLMLSKLNELTANVTVTEVISGGNRRKDTQGRYLPTADHLGECWALTNNIPLRIVPADWDKLGKKAGPIRNEQMSELGDALVAFWNGSSRGTYNAIGICKLRDLKVRVVRY